MKGFLLVKTQYTFLILSFLRLILEIFKCPIWGGSKLPPKIPNPFFFKDKILDDDYILNKNKIFFKTEDYSVKITSSEKENYLQLYTPKNDLAIAIEPMTGVSDSFNNGIGLKKLYSKDKYEIKWELNISTSKN